MLLKGIIELQGSLQGQGFQGLDDRLHLVQGFVVVGGGRQTDVRVPHEQLPQFRRHSATPSIVLAECRRAWKSA